MRWHRYLHNPVFKSTAVAGVTAFGFGCAGWDNPSSLSELTPAVTFELETTDLETFAETGVRVRITDAGRPMGMRDAQLEFEPTGSGDPVTIQMEEHEGTWEAHVTFFQAGPHRLRFRGTPDGHHLSQEWGEHDVDVARHHQIIGPYWVELAVNPAPIIEHTPVHLELFVYNLAPDGTRGAVVASAVPVAVGVHDPAGGETTLTVIEEAPGEYGTEAAFGAAGEYQLHVTVGPAGDRGEFLLPVLAPASDQPDGNDGNGGAHGHGN